MQTSHNAGLSAKLALGLCLLAIGIVITDLTGRALTGTPDFAQPASASLDP